jgi:hypothetical protein
MDGAPLSIAALPAVFDAVMKRIEEQIDGGAIGAGCAAQLSLALKACTSVAPFCTDLATWKRMV